MQCEKHISLNFCMSSVNVWQVFQPLYPTYPILPSKANFKYCVPSLSHDFFKYDIFLYL